jgi:Na+:H+ antiporter, NhaA family
MAAQLDPPVDNDRDHIRGNVDAPLTLVEYGDYECPYSARAAPVVEELRGRFGDELRFVFRNLPLIDIHPHAEPAAEAAEAADAQGSFWQMHARLFEGRKALDSEHLERYAKELGLDSERLIREVREQAYVRRIAEDLQSAGRSGALGTPTFFVNGRLHEGSYDADTLGAALEAARAQG